MATIRIHRAHALGVAKAKKAVDKVAKHIRERFEIEAQWNRNTLEFSPSGVEGEIAVEIDSVSVHADISWMLADQRHHRIGNSALSGPGIRRLTGEVDASRDRLVGRQAKIAG